MMIKKRKIDDQLNVDDFVGVKALLNSMTFDSFSELSAKDLLLKIDSEEKMKIVGLYVKNPNFDDIDEYCKYMFQNSCKKPHHHHHHHTETASGDSLNTEASQIPVVAAAAVATCSEAETPIKQKRLTIRFTMTEEKKKVNPVLPLDQPLELPAELKRYMEREEEASKPVLVIQKRLTCTDVNPNHGRLSLPLRQINRGFLKPKEEALLRTRIGRKVPQKRVRLIEPSGKVRKMYLRKWDMKKDSGKVSSTYNLVRRWRKVVKKNKLRKGMIMQLWSFRVGSKLWLSLLKV